MANEIDVCQKTKTAAGFANGKPQGQGEKLRGVSFAVPQEIYMIAVGH